MTPSKTFLSATVFGALLLGPPAFAEPDLALGAELFELCAQCHGTEGEGDRVALAPVIAGMDEWYVLAQLEKFQQGYRGTHFDDLAGMRMRPMAFTLMKHDGEKMVANQVEMEAVAAYVASLPPQKPEATAEGGDVAKGQALYGPCIACHAIDGTGNQALGGSPLRNQSDWYLIAQLDRYRQGIRGWKADDVQGGMMRGMVATLPDEQAVQDVVAYIQTLGGAAE